ncbi:MAG: hypothetical protein JW785_02665 [Acidimicrobiia bacterium]|nr:hypothetical protein [Acidimicrobiia bacterium]
MRRILLVLAVVAGLCLGALPGVEAAEGQVNWTRQFGSTGYEIARAVAADSGGVYVAGDVEGVLPGQTAAGDFDVFVRKYDPAGKHLWTRQFGTAGEDHGYGVAVDVSGVYVVGGVEGALPGQSLAGSVDAFVRKYDPDGKHLWTRQFGDIGVGSEFSAEYGRGVAVDATGVYVAGHTSGCLPDQEYCESRDAFVRKYSHAGKHRWTRQFGTNDVDEANGVAVDATGVYVAGMTYGVFPGQTTYPGAWNMDPDAFLAKLDHAGNQVWARQICSTSGSNYFDFGWGVAVGGAAVYVVGSTRAVLPGQTSTGGEDAFVRQYDPAGGEGWTRQVCGSEVPDTQIGWGVAADAAGVYLVGETSGPLPGLPQQGLVGFVRRYDHAGKELWTRTIDTETGKNYAYGVAVGERAMYVAGATSGTLPLQEPNAGSHDVFVRSYEVEPLQVEAVFRSAAANDGWVLESAVGSGKGGSLEAAAITTRVGDDAAGRQYRTVLSFNTASLPDDAVVVGATVRVRRQGLVGDNPFDSMGLLKVDIKTGWFHDSVSLERFDFHAMGTRGNVGRFVKTPEDRWYRAPLRASAWPLVNLTGVTQVRLRFEGNNLNGQADYLSLLTGEAITASRPQLVVTYQVP